MIQLSIAELTRLDILDGYQVLDSAPEQAFDDLVAIAATVCGVPISLVSLVAADRQWFKAETGLGVQQTSREVSFCAHTLAEKQILIVPDAQKDLRFRGNALVSGEPGIRFYAGAPIITKEGEALGTVCVIDREPRTLTPEQISALQALARQASLLLEHRIASSTNAKLAAQAQEALLRAKGDRERLQVAMDAGRLAAWYYDPEKNVVGGDARMGKLFGLDVKEAPAEMWLQAIVDEDRERVGKEFAASLEGSPYNTKYRVTVDGKVCWLHARARLLRESDAGLRMVGICEDVTREEEMSASFALVSERLAIAQRTSGSTTFDWNLQTNKVRWSNESFGRAPSEMTDADFVFGLVYEEDRAELQRIISQSIEKGLEYHHECRGYWPDGSLHWITTAGKPLHDTSGQITSVVGVNVDITSRKLSEAALLRSEKLAAVGRLASTISHEINNPLASVTNLLYITRNSPNLSQADHDYLEMADRELARVRQITAQTLRFHRSRASAVEVKVDQLLEDVLEIYRSRLDASEIAVEVDANPNVSFTAFEGDIRQALSNLVANAFDAMRKGGRLRLRARCTTEWSDMRKGVTITIADTGSGMAPEVRRRLFEAFYTTKGIHGSGLGLWISKRIVHKHRGHLSVRSSTGAAHGSVFRLWMPLKAAESAAEPWAQM